MEEEGALVMQSSISATAVVFLQEAVLRMIPYSVPALFLIALDLLYGVRAAKYRGEKVRISTAIRRSVTKCFSYVCWIIIASTLALAFKKDILEWVVLGVVYFNEMASIVGNYLQTKGIEFSFVGFYRWLLKVIAGKAGEAMDSAEAEGIIIGKDGKARDKKGRYAKKR
ncbi:MAG: phage holin family protein [Bacteroidales bacterium]|nr:phage holin family protein [Bacteroidales bacterium]